MAINFLHKRSNTANKRPTAANLDVGELALNYNNGDPGVYFEDDNGDVRKIGPITVGGTAPNATPATGGSTGNSVGEGWLDTSVTPNELKVWDGTQWVSTGGGSGTPGGADTQVQFNNAGSFDGDANFTFNAADDILSVTEVNSRLDGAVIFIAESGEALSAGDVVYVSGVSGNNPVVSKAQANSSTTMPAFGLVQDAAGASGVEVRVTTFGDFTNFDTSTPGWSLGDTLYVSAATAGELTNSPPTGEANLLQNIGKVARVSSSVGRIKVGGAGRTNATPNLDNGNIFIGDSNNQASTASFATTINTFLSANGVFISPGAATFNGDVSVANQEEFRLFEQTTNGTNYIAFRAPAAVTTTTTFDLPDGDGINGQVLTTNGSQVLSWQTPSTIATQLVSGNGQQTIIPNDTLNNWFFATNGAIRWEMTNAGAWVPATDSSYDIGTTTVRPANIYSDNVDSPLYAVSDNGEVRYYETSANGSNYIAFKAPASVTADTTFTLPDGDGTSGQVLSTDGSGALSWASPSAGALNNGDIFVGNASNVATGVTMSGDATIDNTGAITIANDAVTTAKIIDDAVTGDKIADNVALAGNPTTTTQTAGTNDTTIATTAYADTAAGAKLDPALTSANIFVGNGSNVATGVAMSGDTTIDNTGAVTIANDAVTTVKILDDNVTGAKIVDDVALAGNPTTTTQADTDNSTRIATTAYVRTRVDTALQGLDSKASARAASTGNLTLSGTQTVDGVALSAGDRILVKDQTSASENGIYEVAAGAWSRTDDANDWEELVGAYVFIEDGTINASTGYTTTIVSGGTLGTDPIPWVQFSSAGQVTAGAGLTKTGSQIDVGTADTSRIVVNADDIDLATTGVTGGTYQSVTVDTYGRVTAGTNPTTFAGYNISDTSANLAAAITDETGTGSLVFSADPALTGTPTAPTQTAGDNSTAIATTAYADTAVANIAGTYVDVAGDTMTGSLILDDTTLQITEATDTLTLGASALTADRAVNFQDVAGDIAIVGAGSVDTRYVAVSGDAMTGNLTMNAQSEIRFADSDSSNFVALEAPATVSSDVTFILPAADGTSGQFLSTDGSGTLSFASAGAASLTNGNIFVGNASNVAADVTMSGDVTIDNTGATTIANSVALGGSPTTTTQTAGTNDTTIATTAFVAAAVTSGSVTLNSGEILVGDASNVAQGVTPTGDVTFSNTGVTTISNDAVTTVKILDANVTGAKIESNVALAGNPTTTTQTAGTNNTTIATTAYADAAVAAISGTYVDVAGDAMTGNLTMNAQSEIRFADADSSNYIALEAPATVSADVTFVLPDSDGSANQRLVTDGSGNLSWASSDAGSLTSANIFVGNASNVATGVALSGDATIDNTGALTIANDAVTTAKIINDAVTGDKIADNVALAGSPTTTTQTAGDNSTKIATTAYTDTAVANIAGTYVDVAGDTMTGPLILDDTSLQIQEGADTLTLAAPTLTAGRAVNFQDAAGDIALVGAGATDSRYSSSTLSSGDIFVGNGSNVATGVTMSGDVTIDNAGATTIANLAVSTAKIADDAVTFAKLENVTSGNVIVGDATNQAASVAVSGDVTMSNTGQVDIINDVNLGGNPTTTTQADTDDSTRIATTAFVQNRVDIAIQGLSSKESVVAASTGNLTLSGTQTVDGQALVAGDRILVKDQTNAEENGIYEVATGAWSRTNDANTWDEIVGAFVFVEAGTVNASTGFTTTILAGGTLGTDPIPWVQFSSAGQVSAGAGLTKTGSTIDVVTADSSRIVVNSNSIDLATTAVAAGTYRSVTVDTYGRVTAGTAPTTFAGYGISDTSANLAAALTDETGTGSVVFSASPALTGSPTAPTQSAGTNNTTIATTAYADSAVAAISGTYVDVSGDTMTGPLVLDDTSLQIQEGVDTLTLTASALTADRAVNFQDAAGDIALVGAGSVDTRYVAVAGDTMTGDLNMAANILPDADSTRDLGSATLRFANVYTGDLHLKNDRGDWSMIEEEDALTLRNNVTGKVYNIMMQERV